MQKEDGNKNLLRSNTRNQRQQIQPRRDIENHRVRDKIYRKGAIENGGHLSLLLNRSAILNSVVTPEPRRRRINPQRRKGAWLRLSFTLSTSRLSSVLDLSSSCTSYILILIS